MVSRVRFVGRLVGVVIGTIGWFLVVPVLELCRAFSRRPRPGAAPVHERVVDPVPIAAAPRAKSSLARP